MKVYELPQATGIDAITLVERPEPVPGPRQVLVRVRAASLNFRDLVVAKGGYGRGLRLPLVPLSDGAGEVVAVGEGVTTVKLGQRVAGAFMQTWLAGPYREQYAASALGGAVDGILAEFVILDEDGVVPAVGGGH